MVITRLVATRGEADDEFVKGYPSWGQASEANHSVWSFRGNKLFLYHGCLGRFNSGQSKAISLLKDKNKVSQICKIIAAHIQDAGVNMQDFDEIGILIHPPVGNEYELIQAFRRGALGVTPSFVYGTGHAGEWGPGGVNTKVDEIIASHKKSPVPATIFDGWWKFFLKKSVRGEL